jgi:hypothetical protein
MAGNFLLLRQKKVTKEEALNRKPAGWGVRLARENARRAGAQKRPAALSPPTLHGHQHPGLHHVQRRLHAGLNRECTTRLDAPSTALGIPLVSSACSRR